MKITKVEDRLTLVFHRQPEDLFFDSYTIAGPDTTKSGNWEVWEISAEGSDHVGGIEDVEGQDPLNALMLVCRHGSRPPMIWGYDEQSLLADRRSDGAATVVFSKEPR